MKADRLLERSNLPRRHLVMINRCRRDGEWVQALDRVVELIGTGSMLAIVGGRGVGKTQLAACAVAAACDRQRSSLYTEAGPMFMRIRDAMFKPNSGGELATYTQFTAPSMLVIDQLEERKQSEAEDRMLFAIMNRRYNDEKDTLLLSNETVEAFLASLGSSIASRMSQVGEVIECNWASYRSKSAPGTEQGT